MIKKFLSLTLVLIILVLPMQIPFIFATNSGLEEVPSEPMQSSTVEPMQDMDVGPNEIVDGQGDAFTKVYFYKALPACEATICLTDTEMNLLSGGVLQVLDAEGNLIEEFISTNEGYKINLEIGTYTLHESAAPRGYAFADDIEFTLEEGDNPTIVMVSKSLSVMVSTGGTGTIITAIVAGVLACVAIVFVCIGKKKSKEDEE